MKRQIYLIPLFILFLSFFTLAQPTLIQSFDSEYVLEAGNDYIGLIDFDQHFDDYTDIIIQFRKSGESYSGMAAIVGLSSDTYYTEYEVEDGITFVLYVGANYIDLDVLSSDEETNEVYETRVMGGLDDGTEVQWTDWYYFDIVVEGEQPEPSNCFDGAVSGGVTIEDGAMVFDGVAGTSVSNSHSDPDWDAPYASSVVKFKYEGSDGFIFNVGRHSTLGVGYRVVVSSEEFYVVVVGVGTILFDTTPVLDKDYGIYFYVSENDFKAFLFDENGIIEQKSELGGSITGAINGYSIGSRYSDTNSNNYDGSIYLALHYNIPTVLSEEDMLKQFNLYSAVSGDGLVGDYSGIYYTGTEQNPSTIYDQTCLDTVSVSGYIEAKDQNNIEFPLRNALVSLRTGNNILSREKSNSLGLYSFNVIRSNYSSTLYDFTINDEGVNFIIEDNLELLNNYSLNDYTYNVVTPEQIASLTPQTVSTQEFTSNVEEYNLQFKRDDYFVNADSWRLRYSYNNNNFSVLGVGESVGCVSPQLSILDVCLNATHMYIMGDLEGNLTNFRLVGINDVSIYDGNNRETESNAVTIEFKDVELNPPQQIQSFIPLSFDFDETINLQMNTYFTNYDSIEVSFFDEIDSVTETISINMGGTTTSINKDHIFVELRSVLDDVILQIDSKQTELSTTFTVKAINEDGSVQDTFTFNIIEDLNPPTQITSIANINLEYNDNIVLQMNNYFDNYDSFELVFIDEIASISETLSIDVNGNTQNYNTAYINIELRSVLDDVIIEIDSKETNLNGSFTFRAINDDGSVEQSVPLTIFEDIPQLEQIQSFINQTLGFNEEVSFQFNNYFNNYEFIEVRFYSDNLSQLEEVLIVDRFAVEQETFFNQYFDIELNSDLDNVILNINSKDLNFTTDFTIKAYQDVEFIEDTFNLNISQKPPTLIGGVIDNIINFLPSGEQFSNIQKIFIVIGLLLISSIVMVVSFNFPFSLAIFINGLLFTILVVLGFVPIGLLIVIILAIIGLIILRVK